MTNITEFSIWENGIYQLETEDPALGGAPSIVDGEPVAGHANAQAKQLANRTTYLKTTHETFVSDLADNTDSAKGAELIGYQGGTVADKLGEIVAGAVTPPFVDTAIDVHNNSGVAHPELSAFITSEANRAEAAADAAQASGNIYADTAAGLAATTSGQYFSVPSPETLESFILYLNDSGSAVEKKRYPSSAAVDILNSYIYEASLQESPDLTHVLTDGTGGIIGYTSELGVFFPGTISDGATGQVMLGDPDSPSVAVSLSESTARLGNVDVYESNNGSGFADMVGGLMLGDKAGVMSVGGFLLSDNSLISPDGSLVWSSSIDGWTGPGFADAHYGSASAPVDNVAGYTFPKFTTNRYAISGKDMAIMQAVSIPRVAAWPNGMVLRACYGKSGVPVGTSAEGKGAHIRIDRNDGGNRWRPVGYIYAGYGVTLSTTAGSPNIFSVAGGDLTPGEMITGDGIPDGTYVVSYDSATHVGVLSGNATSTGVDIAIEQTGHACLDCFVHRLPDNRAILVFPHLIDLTTGTAANDLHHATALVIENPQDDPANWVVGPMCRIGDGFPSLPAPLDNGDLIGCIAATPSKINAGTGSNVYGFYTADIENRISFTSIGIVPIVTGSVSYCESRVIQTAANTIMALFRTSVGTYYSTSGDRGFTWDAPVAYVAIPAAVQTNLEMQRLPDGRIIAAHNWSITNPTLRYNMWVYLWDYGASPTATPVAAMLVSGRTLVTYPNLTCLLDRDGHWRGEIWLSFDRGRGNVVTDNGDPTGYSNDLIDVTFCVQAMSNRMTNYTSRSIAN